MEMTEFLQEHWLSLLVASYLMGMMLYGHYRGFLHLMVSMAALLMSLLVVRMVVPQVTGFVRDNTNVYQWVQEKMLETAGLQNVMDENELHPAEQRAMIEGTSLPETIKKPLIENNNEEVYQLLQVDRFVDYVSAYLADHVISSLIFAVVFLAVFVGMRLLTRTLNLIARLPVIYGLNKIAGAVLGLIQGLAYFWVACLVLNLFIGTSWGKYLLDAVEASPWVSVLYHKNLLARLAMGIIWKLF